jgi:hypothetical protein
MTYSRGIGAFRHASNPAWGPAFPAFRKSLSFRPTGDHRGIPLRGESNAIHEPCLDPSACAVCLATCVAACVATRPMPALHTIMPGRCGYHVDCLARRFDHRISTGNSLRYRDPCVRTHRIVDGPSAGLRFQDSPHSNGRSAASRWSPRREFVASLAKSMALAVVTTALPVRSWAQQPCEKCERFSGKQRTDCCDCAFSKCLAACKGPNPPIRGLRVGDCERGCGSLYFACKS